MVSKVVVAFVLPILTFVVVLGLFEWALANVVAKQYQTPLALPLALVSTIAVLLAARSTVRLWRRK